MASKPSGRRSSRAAEPKVAKVTLRLSAETAKRLGVESVMSGESQSAIAERVLAAHLKRWRLPSTIEPGGLVESSESSGRIEDAA